MRINVFLIDYHFSRNDYLRDNLMDVILTKVDTTM